MPGPSKTSQSVAPQPPAQPTQQIDPVLRSAAMIAGIIAGDTYGADENTKVPDEYKPIPTSEGGGDPWADPNDPSRFEASLAGHGQDPKATEPPDHGGTIYSGSFAHDLLAALNMPTTYENVRFINAWMRAETGNQGPGTPAFNPLATTQKYGTYTIFNKVGVKNYSDYHTGVMATADVLVRQPKNAGILAALARGNDALAAARAVEGSGWGTGSGVLRVLGGA